MTSLTVKIHNEDEERALIDFLENRNYEYEEAEEVDATEHLLSSEAMKNHLKDSMQQAQDGKVTAIPLNDLWK